MSDAVQLVFLTGLSGSGKTSASRVFEDLGFYTMDNLPSSLIVEFVELMTQSREGIARAALVVDTRDSTFTSRFPQVLEGLRGEGRDVAVLFFEAADDVLIRRFSETRRTHPLGGEGTVIDAIQRERDLLAPIRGLADRVVDTTNLTTAKMKEAVVAWVADRSEPARLTVTMVTFGFKYGLPRDADWVFDVRFLPNPYFVPGMRELSGRDPEILEFVWAVPEARSFVDRVCDILRPILPLYAREGRTHLTVAVGCTGGRHRSVGISHYLAEQISTEVARVVRVDRDIEKG